MQTSPSPPSLGGVLSQTGQQLNTLMLTFLATCAYVGITASATTDERLLLGTRINLPLLNSEVPLTGFYFLAPALLLVFHLFLLLQQYFTARNANPAPQPGAPDRGLIRFFLRIVFLVVNSLLPLLVLLEVQLSFLAYHSPLMTTWHQFLVLLDLALIWYFFFWALSSLGQPISLFSWRILAASASTLIVLLLSSFVFALPGNGYEYRTGKPFPLSGWVDRSISLPGRVLVSQEPAPEILSVYVQQNRESREAWPAHAEGVRLAGRDLRGADFTNAVLVNADFRGADLTGARFVYADLRGARFTPGGAPEGVFSRPPDREKQSELLRLGHDLARIRPTLLRSADLRHAWLTDANLSLADLRFVNLADAHLEGADLIQANLTQARLDRAVLLGTDLSRSRLDRVTARNADLRVANLADASLLGADLVRARLQGADLSRTNLKRTRFLEAGLQGVDFRQAQTTGADLRHAYFHGALGLTLFAVDLRGAALAGLYACEKVNVPAPELTDFREVNLSEPLPPDWGELQKAIEANLVKGPLQEAALARIDRRLPPFAQVESRSLPTCLSNSLRDNPDAIHGRKVLFDRDQRPPFWPEPDITERPYQVALARTLVGEACTDSQFLEVLLGEAESLYSPADLVLSVELARRLRDMDESCPKLRLISGERRQTIALIAETDVFRIEPGSARP